MAEVIQIVGSSTINLNDSAGFMILPDGWIANVGRDDDDLFEEIKEIMEMNITPTNEDNRAAKEQTLRKVLREARQFHETTWQTSPVYLQVQGPNETNARYALLNGGEYLSATSPHEYVPRNNLGATPMAVLNLFREAGWRDAVPGVAGSPETLTATDGPASPTVVWVANYTDDHSLTHIYNFDDSAGTFGSNEIGNSAFNYFDVASAAPAVADLVYFGSSEGAFHSLVMNHSDTGSNPNYVISWEYWNGAWTTITKGEKIQAWPVSPLAVFDGTRSDGARVIGFQDINDWTTTTINGQAAHWIRAKLGSITSGSGFITQQTDVVYVQKKSFIDIPTTVFDGDLPPHMMLSMAGADDGSAGFVVWPSQIARIIYGFKSIGLGTFTDEILMNEVDMETITGKATWTRTLASGVTEVADPDSPGGSRINVDFSSDPTDLVTRVKMASLQTDSVIDEFRGGYRVFLRCQQIGGSVGDCSIQVRTLTGLSVNTFGPEWVSKTDEIALEAADSGVELVDLGVLAIPAVTIQNNDTLTNELTFDVFAKRASGTSTLRIYSIKLIPINEASGTFNAPIRDTEQANSLLHRSGKLEMDSGIIIPRLMRGTGDKDGINVTIRAEGLEGLWEFHGDYPVIEPSKRYQVYFLLMAYPTGGAFGTGPFMAPTGMILGFELRKHDRYATLRGGD